MMESERRVVISMKSIWSRHGEEWERLEFLPKYVKTAWQEEVLALEEIKQIYENLYEWTKQGERTDLTSSPDEEVEKYWSRTF